MVCSLLGSRSHFPATEAILKMSLRMGSFLCKLTPWPVFWQSHVQSTSLIKNLPFVVVCTEFIILLDWVLIPKRANFLVKKKWCSHDLLDQPLQSPLSCRLWMLPNCFPNYLWNFKTPLQTYMFSHCFNKDNVFWSINYFNFSTTARMKKWNCKSTLLMKRTWTCKWLL